MTTPLTPEQKTITIANLTPMSVLVGDSPVKPLQSSVLSLRPGAETPIFARTHDSLPLPPVAIVAADRPLSAIQIDTELLRRAVFQTPVLGKNFVPAEVPPPSAHLPPNLLVPTLSITNTTPWFVDAYLVEAQSEKRFATIEPGDTWTRQVGALQFWEFRTTFSGEIVGMAISPIQGPLALSLTDEFRKNWQRFQKGHGKQLGKGPVTPLRLIGEVRQSTPGQDAPEFLHAVTVRQEFSKETFNGQKNRILREVEIASGW